jgi:O-antigen ligase
MVNLITFSFFLLALGLITSVSIVGLYQLILFLPACYFLYIFFLERRKPPRSFFFLAVFMLVACASLVVNLDSVANFSKSFGKLKFLFFGLSLVAVLSFWIPNVNVRHLKNIIHTFLSSIIFSGAVAIYQFTASGGGRSEGLIGIMRYGYGSAMISVLLMGIIFQRKKLKLDVNLKLLFVALIFAIVGVLLTQTRGALAGFLCALPLTLYFYRPKVGIFVGILSLIIISIIGYAYLFGTNTGAKNRFIKSRNEAGDVVRREQWQSAIIATREHPLLGWGYNNFYSQVERIKKQNNLKTQFYVNEHAHNIFLEVAAGTGLIGFAFFLLWLITWAGECFKMEGAFRGIFVPFGVCMIVSGQFEVIFDTNNMTLILFVYSVSQYLCLENNQQNYLNE